jgi:hypothetical protein
VPDFGYQAEQEVRAYLRERVRTIEALSWAELDRYGNRVEPFRTSAGIAYRVVSQAYWAMGEWSSGIEIEVWGYAETGWRRWCPYFEAGSRGGEEDPVPEPPPDWKPRRWRERRGVS